jgi:hypothetical protein
MTVVLDSLKSIGVGTETAALQYSPEQLSANAGHTITLDVSRAARIELEIRASGLDAVNGSVQGFWGNTQADCYESYGAPIALSAAIFKDHIEIPVVKGRFFKIEYTPGLNTAGALDFIVFGRS